MFNERHASDKMYAFVLYRFHMLYKITIFAIQNNFNKNIDMKRIFCIIAITAFLTGCSEEHNHKSYTAGNGYEPSFTEAFENTSNDCSFEFYHNNHRYIAFKAWRGYNGYMGIVHDPDCPCHMHRDSININD